GDPDVARKLLEGALDAATAYERTLRLGPGVFGPTSGVDLLRAANGLATMAWFYRNIVRLGDGRDPELQMNLLGALIAHQRFETDAARRLERA
ncbi:MAG: NADH:flavin oxidoreductase, partial [Pseudomonadota bacterium]